MSETAVSVQDLTVTTTQGTQIVAPVSFAIQAGEILGLVGKWGAVRRLSSSLFSGLHSGGLASQAARWW